MAEDLSGILESPEHTLLAAGLGDTEGPPLASWGLPHFC